MIGCNNGIRGFHENLVTFWGTKLPGFCELKRCASKNAVLRDNKKAGKSVPEATKCKVAENHRNKKGPNPNVLAYFKNRDKYVYIRVYG